MDGRHDRSSGLLAAPSDAGTPLAHASASPALGSTTGGAASPDALSDVLRTVRLTGALFFLVGRALALLHARPADGWTLETLARDVGLSRSALADRFTHFVGQPPMQHLTHWRMQVAARLLAEGAAKVSAVALEGYDSEAAFSRAFRRVARVPPAAWRARCAARPPAPR